ncbi:autotransporter-associated beta strand repeat-containing protein, partial [Bradyrhizobium sp. ORS 375]|uniref:autotransporter-associated beta strand repeat-containing protein n=1 Tax=Bradyrhizobium sp. (strain ORS 375) TaxID=566679 RepID=UPI0015857FEA
MHTLLLTTSALALLGSATSARADDGTWQGGVDGVFSNNLNWSGSVLPDGVATFGQSNRTSITSQSFWSVDTLKFNAGSSSYDFTIAAGSFALTGAGIVTQPGAGAVRFDVESTLQFIGLSKAATAKITNNQYVRFTESASADGATIENRTGASLLFADKSTAAKASITNTGTTSFEGSATADRAIIANNFHAGLDFLGTSTAADATINSSGIVSFREKSSGGAARLSLTDRGILDVSTLTTSGTTIGSLEGSGTVRLGGKNLTVGGNNIETTFAGTIRDLSESGGTGGSLTKEGRSALTLSGSNGYTGATRVTGGWLIVDGSIASSSGVTVDAGATLGGGGTVSSTVVNDGGTLSAGSDAAQFGTLKVRGDLALAKGATYAVNVSPDAASKTSVTGTATLGGATVSANFVNGSYVTKQYGILDANSVTGRFGQLVTGNLLPIFSASLTYDPNHVFLNVTADGTGGGGGRQDGGGSSGGGSGRDGDPLRGYNVNQRNVMGGLANA